MSPKLSHTFRSSCVAQSYQCLSCSYPLGAIISSGSWMPSPFSWHSWRLPLPTWFLDQPPCSFPLCFFLHHDCGLAWYSQRYEKGLSLSSSPFGGPQESDTFWHILGSSQYHSSMSQWHREYDVTPASQNSGQKADAGCPLLTDPGTQHSHLFLDCKQDHVYIKNMQLKLFFSNSYTLSSQWAHHQFHSKQN